VELFVGIVHSSVRPQTNRVGKQKYLYWQACILSTARRLYLSPPPLVAGLHPSPCRRFLLSSAAPALDAAAKALRSSSSPDGLKYHVHAATRGDDDGSGRELDVRTGRPNSHMNMNSQGCPAKHFFLFVAVN
jgi:hypothetical protein